MMHKEANSDEFLDVGETFWRVGMSPAASETDFLDPPVLNTQITVTHNLCCFLLG